MLEYSLKKNNQEKSNCQPLKYQNKTKKKTQNTLIKSKILNKNSIMTHNKEYVEKG